MKLYISENSPYARRARIAVREGGLIENVEEICISSEKQLLDLGAGGKIPILVTDSGTSLCESLVIARYLDDLTGGVLWPRDPERMVDCLALESMASVLMDSMFVRSMEKNHREQALRSQSVIVREEERALRCYDALESMMDDQIQEVSLGSIALVS